MTPLHAALLWVEALLRLIVWSLHHRPHPCDPIRVLGRPPAPGSCAYQRAHP